MQHTQHRIPSVFIVCGSLLGVLSIAGVGCGGGAEEQANTNTADDFRAETSPSADRNVELTHENTGSGEPCRLQTVLFNFDSAELTPGARNNIQRAVNCYQEQGMPARLHLTGATDPRGTEEYNIALGERRARGVSDYITSLGIDGTRVGITSMGEETATGADESGWTRDRNVTAVEESAAP